MHARREGRGSDAARNGARQPDEFYSLKAGGKVRVKSVFRQAQPEEIEEIFSLYGKRIRWMDENGVRQWNATDYLAVYPAKYYRGQ